MCPATPDHFLADPDLGHDDRAGQPQPVAAKLGPRFYDWRLSQDAAEAWRVYELNSRNVLGAEEFEKLQAELEGRQANAQPLAKKPRDSKAVKNVEEGQFG